MYMAVERCVGEIALNDELVILLWRWGSLYCSERLSWLYWLREGALAILHSRGFGVELAFMIDSSDHCQS